MNDIVTNPRTVLGTVVSDKMDKSIVVLVVREVPHQKYRKYVKKSSKFCAHDEQNKAKIGDTVKIKETRPRSKTKTWELLEIVETAA